MIRLDNNGVPDFQSLMLPVLKSGQESEVRIRDVAEQLADDLSRWAMADRLTGLVECWERSGDDGVDGVVDQDALGLDRVYVQAKRHAADNGVGPSAIRDFFGSLDRHKAGKGLFVTTSAFSRSARETADRLGKRIARVEGATLARLMIRHDVGCQT